jgi:diaminohydroxyphosphoribosylaminopyrimidine deaminase/5-amino-6-(5-phosphoribosylamino)uracil reductase
MDIFMDRALQIAQLGGIEVKSNPLVGAVIVKNGHIISEGYHKKFGSYHAEIDALTQAKEDVSGATIYVTLEPCSHVGKTGSCAQAIIEAGIKKVVIASIDPNPLVSGKGIEMLKQAGLDVEIGLRKEQSDAMNTMFYHFITKRKPYVAIKMALTLDGKYSTHLKDSKWITSTEVRDDVHDIRANYQSILVGVQTIIEDDPSLNVRKLDKVIGHPTRIILDTHGRIPIESKVIQDGGPTIICTHDMSKEKIAYLESKGIQCLYIKLKEAMLDMDDVLDKLYARHIKSVFVEGGKKVHEHILTNQLAQYVYVYIAPKIVGGLETLQHPQIDYMKDALQIKKPLYKIIDGHIKLEGEL